MNDIDYSGKTKLELQNIIKNHADKGTFATPEYAAAVRHLDCREHKAFNLELTIEAIVTAGAQSKCISYKEVADANSVDWSKVYRSIGSHLGAVCDYAHAKGWPLLTAVVVNSENVNDGVLNPGSLASFIKKAQELRRVTGDQHEAFVKSEQQRVFEWAQGRIK